MIGERLTVEVVPPRSVRLRAVKALWRQNRTTLGFFPDGAFEDHARKGWVLGACGQSGSLEGYLIYRLSGAAVVIVHLCIAEQFRGKGLARRLVESLRAATADCSGIRANCRADFAANAMWPKLNFVVRRQQAARERGRILKTWWCDYGNPDLFSLSTRDTPIAVLDANVFFDFRTVEDHASVESRGLLVDWLEEIVQLALAPEIFNEIDRRLEPRDRDEARRQAEGFLVVRPPAGSLASWVDRVDQILPPAESTSDESDRRQLAGSIAAGARFFVTRDGLLLDHAARILEDAGIRILRPSELIGLSDEELNAAAYQPVRLAGLRLTLGRAKASDVDDLVSRFLAHESGERKVAFLASMRSAAASPEQMHVMRVNDADGAAVALLVLNLFAPDTLRVVHLRVQGTPSDSTLTQHLVWHVVREAARQKCTRVDVIDQHLSQQAKDVLARLHFMPVASSFVKRNAYGLLPMAEMAGLLDSGADGERSVDDARGAASSVKRRQLLLEAALWPCKALDGELPTYIVPIRPHWAMHLFDEPTSQDDLFGADPTLLLRTENIYYRAARPKFPEGAARVLWYVSDGRGFTRAKHLVGCSLVTEVWIGPAKGLFTRFRRLGVFDWRQVLKIARGTATNQILAFTFSHTELFSEPVPLTSLRKLLRKWGLGGTTLQGPIRVPEELFVAVYQERVL